MQAWVPVSDLNFLPRGSRKNGRNFKSIAREMVARAGDDPACGAYEAPSLASEAERLEAGEGLEPS
jgi:hypothetical protein